MNKNLDPNKAYCHDMISIWMAKTYDTSICKLLELIFLSCLEYGKFLTEWKKANVVPAHKKGDKQNLKNYLCFLLLEKYLKEYCKVTCIIFLKKMT